MEARKLTPEQIDDLFAFCEEQDVPYYDVQIELVDHLANAIEQKWADKPNLSYEKALWMVFDQFGVSGFRKIRNAKEKALRKKYNVLLWKYMGEFFRLPKIVLIGVITLAIFTFLRISTNNLETSLFFWIGYMAIFFILHMINRKGHDFQLNTKKLFLLYDHFQSVKSRFSTILAFPGYLLPAYIMYLQRTTFNPSHNIYIEFSLALLITIFCIFFGAMSFYIPQRIKADFIREFPQFVKA